MSALSLNQIIAVLLTVGGTGFVNYIVTDQLGVTDLYEDANQARLGYCALWSIIDFALYVLIERILKPVLPVSAAYIVAMLITLLLAWLGTLLLAWPIHNFLFWAYSKIDKMHKPKGKLINEGSVLDNELSEIGNKFIETYLFTLDHKPISAGILKRYSVDEKNKEQLVLTPFNDDNYKSLESYDDLNKRILEKGFQSRHKSREYVDLQQKYIAIFVFD